MNREKVFETSFEFSSNTSYRDAYDNTAISLMNIVTEDQLRTEMCRLQNEVRILWECIKELKKGEQQ